MEDAMRGHSRYIFIPFGFLASLDLSTFEIIREQPNWIIRLDDIRAALFTGNNFRTGLEQSRKVMLYQMHFYRFSSTFYTFDSQSSNEAKMIVRSDSCAMCSSALFRSASHRPRAWLIYVNHDWMVRRVARRVRTVLD
jgi:hypothetical protein